MNAQKLNAAQEQAQPTQDPENTAIAQMMEDFNQAKAKYAEKIEELQ